MHSTAMPHESSVPLREIVIDKMTELTVEKDAKMMIPQDVAQTNPSANGDGNGLVKKDVASNKTDHTKHTKDANGKTTTTDTVDEELSLKLRELLSAGSTTANRLTAPQVGRRFSVDAGHFEQHDNEREQDDALSSCANIMRNHRQRSISLRSLTGDAGVSTNLREQLHAGGRSASMRSLGRQPSLRRRHSTCCSIPPPCSATTVSSEQSFSNSTALSTPQAPDRRASMSCVDARSVSLSSIIAECHPLSVGIGNFSSDDESSDDDSSVGSTCNIVVVDRSATCVMKTLVMVMPLHKMGAKSKSFLSRICMCLHTLPFGFRGFVEGIPITPKKGHSCTHFSFPTTCFVSRYSLREERKYSSTRGYLLDLLIQ